MGGLQPEACSKCGTRILRFSGEDGKVRLVCPRCESDQLASIFEKDVETGGHGPKQPRPPKSS